MSRTASSPFEAVLRRTSLPESQDGEAGPSAPVRSTPWFVPQTMGADARPDGIDATRLTERYMDDPPATAPPGIDRPDAAPTPRSLDPGEIAAELDLAGCASVEALRLRRRRFAQTNHPDKLHPALRANATERMMIANRLVDQAIVRRRGFGPSG